MIRTAVSTTVRSAAVRRVAPVVAARMASTSVAPVAVRVPLVALVGAAGLGLAATVSLDGEVDYKAVREEVDKLLDEDDNRGPLLVRLAWHASGTYDAATKTGGSNGSTMRFPLEAGDGANAGLHKARALLEPIKKKFPGISYADLWTLAAAEAIEFMGGPAIPWRAGRTDASDDKAVPPNGRLPDAAQGASHVRDVFYRMGFNDREITALAGAHALGRCHKDRSGFEGPWTRAPTTFSNEYFVQLKDAKWSPRKWDGPFQYENEEKDLMMLPADIAFITDGEFRKFVDLYAADEDVFFKDFASAFSKLMELGVPFKEDKKSLWSRIFG